MKAECIKDRFEKALITIEKCAARNATLPVLSCVHIDAHTNSLLLKTTNLEIGVEISIPAKVIEPGSVAVPIGNLLAFVSAASAEKTVQLAEKDATLVTHVGRSVAVFNTMNQADFPSIPKLHSEFSLSLPIHDFVAGIKSVLFSAAVNTVKPEYASVYVYISHEGIVFAATDSFRLAEKKMSLKRGYDKNKEPITVLIPHKNAQELIKMLVLDEDKDVEIKIEGHHIAFLTSHLYVSSRLIEGTFPDYKQIIPKSSETEVVAAKQDVVDALKVATIFSDSFSQVSVRVSPKDKVFEVTTKNSIVGEQKTEIPAAFNGVGIDANFNHHYITECLPVIGSDNISFSFSEGNKPMIIKGVSDKSFLYLVMPMNR